MNFLTRFQKSITDFEFYRKLREESVGKAFLYLAKIVIIFGVISLINPVLNFDRGVDEVRDYFRENIPYFVFEDGALNMKENQPFFWEDQEAKIVIVMDTSGQVGPEILNNYHEGFYINKNNAVFKRNGIEKREFNFSQLAGVKFTKDDVSQWIPYLKWFNGFVVIFGLIGFLISKLWSALLITLFGLLICSGKNRFPELFKISIYALTLPIAIKVVKEVLVMKLPWFGLIYYGIAGFYMWKVIDLIRKDRAITE